MTDGEEGGALCRAVSAHTFRGGPQNNVHLSRRTVLPGGGTDTVGFPSRVRFSSEGCCFSTSGRWNQPTLKSLCPVDSSCSDSSPCHSHLDPLASFSCPFSLFTVAALRSLTLSILLSSPFADSVLVSSPFADSLCPRKLSVR